MKGLITELPRIFSPVRIPKAIIILLLIILLAAAALSDFFIMGLARRTFVFYTIDNEVAVVEDRMLRVSARTHSHSSFRELDITRYVEEALLGPVSPDSLPLFPKETKLVSLLYRDGVVYADFSKEAALPPVEGGEVVKNIKTLYSGVKRNFPFVRDIRFFIAGEAAWTEEFRL